MFDLPWEGMVMITLSWQGYRSRIRRRAFLPFLFLFFLLVSSIALSPSFSSAEHILPEDVGVYVVSYHPKNPYLRLSLNESSTFCFDILEIDIYTNNTNTKYKIYDLDNQLLIFQGNFTYHKHFTLNLRNKDSIAYKISVGNYSLTLRLFVLHSAMYLTEDKERVIKYLRMTEKEYLLEIIKVHYLTILGFFVPFPFMYRYVKLRKDKEGVRTIV